MLRKLDQKSPRAIASEWDILAPIRLNQIVSGTDITYRYVLIPNILSLIPNRRMSSVLDAGCGIGFLSNLLVDYAAEVVGIDASAESIKLAHSTFGARVKFIHQTVEGHAKRHVAAYDLVVANMVLMDVIDLKLFLSALHRVLRPEGVLIFSITHPCFWPQYYGYDQKRWYRYDRELIIEAPFRITNAPDCPLLSTHIHRPLQSYITALRLTGFGIKELCEPMPSQEIEVLYPCPWAFPRYLVGSCHMAS